MTETHPLTSPTQVRPQVRPERVGPGIVGQVRPAPPPLRGADRPTRSVHGSPKSDPTPGSDRTCRTCGCTDNNACQDTTTGPCHWIAHDLCSSCEPKDSRP